ncbi:hypothetical protein BC938DRAFT_473139 [Jimgerdemannia flammicorona]|uniref:Uncharacterized protein n=1 Tax=Jimgerdemannia flammicorona TaxID=994334 RepID=A0A433Q4W3_9FUNG|nr:hypothetical protein BC938DRAFT_473139 [Jimgerdemannia flammicorona]
MKVFMMSGAGTMYERQRPDQHWKKILPTPPPEDFEAQLELIAKFVYTVGLDLNRPTNTKGLSLRHTIDGFPLVETPSALATRGQVARAGAR